MGWFENMGWFEWIVVGQLSFLIILMAVIITLMVVMADYYWGMLARGIDRTTERGWAGVVLAIQQTTEKLQPTMDRLDENVDNIETLLDAMRDDKLREKSSN